MLPLGGAKQRAVLALLLLHANEVVSADRLIDELWGESPPTSAANMLQGYISHLRKALEPGRARGDHEILVSRPPGYVLQIRPDQLDAERCVRLISDGRRLLEAGNGDAAAERFREALALWRGPPLADLAYESFARPDVNRLEDLRLAAVEDRIEADLTLGRQQVLVGELRELVAKYPYRERLRGELMTALYRSGRQAEALEVYREGRRILGEELGIEPGPALRELERAILLQEPRLAAPVPRQASVISGKRGRRLLLAAAVGLGGAALAAGLTLGGSRGAELIIVKVNSVVVIDPTTDSVVADIPVGGYPGPLSADSRFLYVANIGDATISRINPKSKAVFGTFSLSRATDLIAGDGFLWAANGGSPGHTPIPPGTIVDYGLASAAAKTIRVGPSVVGDEEQTTLATDAAHFGIWVGNKDSETVRQIDTSLGTIVATIHGVAPGGLAAVGNASVGDTVWASDPSRNLIARIDGNSGRITRWIPVPGEPTRLAADETAVWVVTRASRAVWRIDATTNRRVAKIALPITPKRVVLGAGSVWVSGYRWSDHIRSSRGGMVIRIDPATNDIAARISLGDVATDGILVSHGLVWVAVPPSA